MRPSGFWEDGEHGSQRLDGHGCCPQCGGCYINIIGLEFCLTCDAITTEEEEKAME